MKLIRGNSLIVLAAWLTAWAAMAGPAGAGTDDCADTSLPAAIRAFACSEAIQAGETDPEKFADLFIHRAEALTEQGFPEQALSDLTRAVRLAPRQGHAFVARARANFALHRKQPAIDDLAKALRLNPDNVEALVLQARVLNTAPTPLNLRNAVRSATKALKIKPNHYDALVERGSAYRKLRRYQDAYYDLDRAVADNPDNGRAFFHRGATLLAQKLYDMALADFDRAARLLKGRRRRKTRRRGRDGHSVPSRARCRHRAR